MIDPTKLHYIYARCTKKKRNLKCTQKTIRIDRLDKQVKDYLSSIKMSPRAIEWTLKQIQKQNQTTFHSQDQIRINLEANLNQKQAEIDSLLASYTEPANKNRDLISPEEYQARRTKLIGERSAIEAKLKDCLANSDIYHQEVVRKFNFSVTAYRRFNKGSYRVKSEIIHELGSNLILKDRKISVANENLFVFIKKAKQKLDVLKAQGLEPEKSIDAYEKTGVVDEVISTLQAHQDSNLDEGFWRPSCYRYIMSLQRRRRDPHATVTS